MLWYVFQLSKKAIFILVYKILYVPFVWLNEIYRERSKMEIVI